VVGEEVDMESDISTTSLFVVFMFAIFSCYINFKSKYILGSWISVLGVLIPVFAYIFLR